MAMLKRLGSILAVAASLNAGLAPAFAEPVPYFRMPYSLDASQALQGLQVTGGPTGTYYTRVNGLPAMDAPKASAGPATWGISGALPPGVGVDQSSGALTGGATTVGGFGPAAFVATVAGKSGGSPQTATG